MATALASGGWAASAAVPAAEVAGAAMVFEIDDHEVLNPVQVGRVRLLGALEVRFKGRIAPHEDAVYSFFGSDVESIEGKFDCVVLPVGRRYDLSYDEKAWSVTMRHVRPDRAPAFPGVEGFGKYTVGGRSRRSIEVTNLNDRRPGNFRAAAMAAGPRTVMFRV